MTERPVHPWRLFVVLFIGFLMIPLIDWHLAHVNGPWYWRWAWRRLGWETYPLMLAAALPLIVGQWLYARRRIGARGAIALAMLAAVLMQVAAQVPQPLGVGRVVAVVQNSVNTSYYTAAEVLYKEMTLRGKTLRDWMEIYPQLMPVLMLHASFKPPGWILFFLGLMFAFGGPGKAAAAVGAGIVALLAAAGVAVTYQLARFFGHDEDAAVCGATFFACTPSLLLFWPQGDQAYPLIACGVLITWVGALRGGRRSRWLAAACGALMMLGTFLSAVFLMLGVFLLVWTLLELADRKQVFHVLLRGAIAAGTFVALYVVLYAALGFDPVDTFFTANRRSQAHLVELQRPWPLHTPLDLVDIALGTGWISVPLLIWGAAATWRSFGRGSPQRRVVFVGLLQVAMSVAVAVFPGENARLMLPLLPLLMIPIGVELSRWPATWRFAVFALLVLITAATCQNMVFLYMGFEIDAVPR